MNKKELMEITEKYRGYTSMIYCYSENPQGPEIALIIEKEEIPDLDDFTGLWPKRESWPVVVDDIYGIYKIYFPQKWVGSYNKGEWPYCFNKFIPLTER